MGENKLEVSRTITQQEEQDYHLQRGVRSKDRYAGRERNPDKKGVQSNQSGAKNRRGGSLPEP